MAKEEEAQREALQARAARQRRARVERKGVAMATKEDAQREALQAWGAARQRRARAGRNGRWYEVVQVVQKNGTKRNRATHKKALCEEKKRAHARRGRAWTAQWAHDLLVLQWSNRPRQGRHVGDRSSTARVRLVVNIMMLGASNNMERIQDTKLQGV